MRALVLALLALCLAVGSAQADEKIVEYPTTTIPVWGDTLRVDTTAVDTCGIVRINRGGVFTVVLWADSTAGTVDLKLEYQLMRLDMVYYTPVTETLTVVHPARDIIRTLSSTWQPTKYRGNWWTTIASGIHLYNERDCWEIYPPLSQGIRLRVSGGATNAAGTKALVWVEFSP